MYQNVGGERQGDSDKENQLTQSRGLFSKYSKPQIVLTQDRAVFSLQVHAVQQLGKYSSKAEITDGHFRPPSRHYMDPKRIKVKLESYNAFKLKETMELNILTATKGKNQTQGGKHHLLIEAAGVLTSQTSAL